LHFVESSLLSRTIPQGRACRKEVSDELGLQHRITASEERLAEQNLGQDASHQQDADRLGVAGTDRATDARGRYKKRTQRIPVPKRRHRENTCPEEDTQREYPSKREV
jgi:hypothetical protein